MNQSRGGNPELLGSSASVNIHQVVKRVLQKTEAVLNEIQLLERLFPQGSVLIRQVKYLIVALHQEVLVEIGFPNNRSIPLMNTIRLKFLTLYWMAHHHIFPKVLEQLAEVHCFLHNVYSMLEHGVQP
ncbi:MAG: hypothetical protein ACE5I5_03180 [Candidatus Heimdallarchaeota archaeon]